MEVTLRYNGLGDYDDYHAWKFPGGEVHVKIKESAIDSMDDQAVIVANIKDSDDLMALLLIVDTIKSEYDVKVRVVFPYLPYQQADRVFSEGESFSLLTLTKLLKAVGVDYTNVYDPHSDIAAAIMPCMTVESNDDFIEWVVDRIKEDALVMMSPDAGAFKKVFKLAESINFEGEVESASKYRDSEGNIFMRVPKVAPDVPILVVDDICLGGKTFTSLAKELRKNGHTGDLYLAVSHGIFTNGTEELKKYYKGIYTTDTRREANMTPDVIIYRLEE